MEVKFSESAEGDRSTGLDIIAGFGALHTLYSATMNSSIGARIWRTFGIEQYLKNQLRGGRRHDLSQYLMIANDIGRRSSLWLMVIPQTCAGVIRSADTAKEWLETN